MTDDSNDSSSLGTLPGNLDASWGKTSRGRCVFVGGYEYHHNRNNKRGDSIWVCKFHRMTKCSARINVARMFDGDDSNKPIITKIASTDHNHDPQDLASVEARQLKLKLVMKAKQSPESTASLLESVVLEAPSDRVAIAMGSKSALTRRIQRAKASQKERSACAQTQVPVDCCLTIPSNSTLVDSEPNQTDDLVYWQVLRWASSHFLSQVTRFFVFDYGNSALLFSHDSNDNIPKCHALGNNTSGSLGVGKELWKVTTLTELAELRGKTIIQLSHGISDTMALTNEGDLFGCGLNRYGELGCGDTKSQFQMTLVMQHVKQVSCGYWFTVAVTRDGNVWSWGWNERCQLGLGSQDNQYKPTQISGLFGVAQVACVQNGSLALTEQSQVYHWGEWNSVRLATPTEVPLPPGITVASITAGREDFMILTNQGHVHYCFYATDKSFQCQRVELNQPVESIVYPFFFNDNPYCLKSRGRVTVWNKARVIHTNLSSLTDCCALYGNPPVTPLLTSLSSKALDSLSSIIFLNNPTYSNLQLTVDQKHIHLNREAASALSPYLASQIHGLWENRTHAIISHYEYACYITFLRYIFTGTLGEIQPEWAGQLLQLAIESKNADLCTACFRVIQAYLGENRLLK